MSHRLSIVYADGSVQQLQQLRQLRHDAATGHVAVLSHGYLGVAEVIGAEPRGQALVVDGGGNCLAEAVRGRLRDSKFLAGGAALLVEVVRVTPTLAPDLFDAR